MTHATDWVRSAVVRHERALLAYVAHLLGDIEPARDVVQEAFARLLVQQRGATEPHLPQWLFTVCRNLAFDVRRKEKRMSLLDPVMEMTLPDSSPAPPVLAENADDSARALSFLQTLPPDQQEVLRLKFQHDMKYQQIAEVTGHSPGNVGFLLSTGLKTLREKMNAQT